MDDATKTPESIGLIEELAANAWPAEVVDELDGWRLRFNWGVTSRANSVWPNRAGRSVSLADRLDAVERFYAKRQAPARYHITPVATPRELDDILSDRGYATCKPSLVQTASSEAVGSRTASELASTVLVAEAPTAEWFETYNRSEELPQTVAARREGIVRRIQHLAGFALLRHRGEAIAVGLGVLERGYVGIFSMATHPRHRRTGGAAAILHGLARWASDRAAGRMYLQVQQDNAAAVSLYARAGFSTLYPYHYREEPVG